MNREIHVRLCERLGVKFPGPTRRSIALYPRLKRSKYGVYKEAWERLRGPARVDRIEACADETFAEDFGGGGWAFAAELG